MKRQPTVWEKIVANNMTNKGLISRVYKHTAQLKKNDKPIKKWADISLKKTYKWPEGKWKDVQT